MTSLSLKQVVEKALAEVGANPRIARKPKGKARTTKAPAGPKKGSAPRKAGTS